ncbi:M20 family metallopeptidase [Thalassoroseus pseudoceratinae]|uniref:M20 family metallopeptidase n=1 Tax=Thalassoroseus pseudoceratinae TaxID=2713176 RepID=UPI001424186C|nr:M20 family metallopeptidase [Thalassoroseus pseudoceratinae]
MLVTDRLKELIAIPSVNPMGRDITGPEYFEARVTEYLTDVFKTWGVPFKVTEITPGRANIVARWDGSNGRTVLLDAHQDTVPVSGMTIPPFEPAERDGKIYGRGSCDVKGGLAAMLTAFGRLVHEQPSDAATVFLSCTCDEEAGAKGVTKLAEQITQADESSFFWPRPEAAIVAEPTNLDVVVAHRGAVRWKIATTGRACHSSRPEDGINAIYRMARLLSALEEYAGLVGDSLPPHPLCGPATLSVGRIEGGASVNIVPDACVIEIDRRLIPGEDGESARQQVAEFLRSKLDFEFEMQPPWIASPPLPDDDNGALADGLLKTIESIVGPHQRVGVPYGTNGSRLAAIDVPTVVFGPGDIAQAHTKDEWIDIAELEQSVDVYYQFCVDGSF